MQKITWITIFMAVFGLNGLAENKSVAVGIYKNGESFAEWFKQVDSSIEVIDLSLLPEKESVVVLQRCYGFILSGGLDIDPAYYGKPEKASLCLIDSERDRREWALAMVAIERKIPLLGICRGFQFLNVIYGGTLIADIPTEVASHVAHRIENGQAYHVVSIEQGTILCGLVSTDYAVVNSNHHQAIDRLADPFLVSARSRDQLIEAFEWKEKDNQPFLLAVEWHPERMTDPLSKRIAEAFIIAVKENSFSSSK
jgi:putative glutamine amidotransferase